MKTNFFTPPKGWVNLGWGDFASLDQSSRREVHIGMWCSNQVGSVIEKRQGTALQSNILLYDDLNPELLILTNSPEFKKLRSLSLEN